LTSKKYLSGEFIFPKYLKATSKVEDNPQRKMEHEIFKEETYTFGFPIIGSNEETKMNNILIHPYLFFMVYLNKTLTPSSLNMTCFEKVMIKC
jgi:hypothetical protein